MLNSILTMVDRSVVDLSEWWDSISTTYRGAACMLLALFLMWEATKSSEDRDRRFFLTGIAALGLLAYGAIVFINGDNSR
jgi:hypothetical protein